MPEILWHVAGTFVLTILVSMVNISNSQTPSLWHLIQRQNHKRRRQGPNQGGHWTTRWPLLYRQDQETEMVWTCYTSNRTCKHHHAGHSPRREETRQTKEMLARHQGMDGAAYRQDPETSRRQRRLEEDHQNICGAPTAPPPLLPPPPPHPQRLRDADADADETPSPKD